MNKKFIRKTFALLLVSTCSVVVVFTSWDFLRWRDSKDWVLTRALVVRQITTDEMRDGEVVATTKAPLIYEYKKDGAVRSSTKVSFGLMPVVAPNYKKGKMIDVYIDPTGDGSVMYREFVYDNYMILGVAILLGVGSVALFRFEDPNGSRRAEKLFTPYSR